MRTNELRVGNLVDTMNRTQTFHFPNRDTQRVLGMVLLKVLYSHVSVSEFDPKHCKEIGIEDVCGIPLTVDWLERLGCSPCKDREVVFELNMRFITLGFDKEAKAYLYQGEDGYDMLCEFDDIKDVHQLQNLNFALTGEELHINL